MLTITEDMLRATRLFDASGRPLCRETTQEREFAEQLALCGEAPASGGALRAAWRWLLGRRQAAEVRAAPCA